MKTTLRQINRAKRYDVYLKLALAFENTFLLSTEKANELRLLQTKLKAKRHILLEKMICLCENEINKTK